MLLMLCSSNGDMSPETPVIIIRLNMFDPMTFPNASCGFFLIAATTDVISSGSDVPTATTVMPITASLMPHAFASDCDELRNICPPNISPQSVAIIMIMSNTVFLPASVVGHSSSDAFPLFLSFLTTYVI